MVSTEVPADEGLDAATFRVYVYMVKAGRLVGPRDVMRGAALSSPSVAHRQLQKLLDLGLIQKDVYGRYEIKEKAGLKGYFWFGKMLVPRLIFYSLFFIGFLTAAISGYQVFEAAFNHGAPENREFIFAAELEPAPPGTIIKRHVPPANEGAICVN